MTERYDKFWAGYLGITPAELNEPGVSVAAHVGLSGYSGVWFFRRKHRTVVSAPAEWLSVLRNSVRGVDDETLTSVPFFKDAFGKHFERVVGPAFQGYLAGVNSRVDASSEIRFLGSNDGAAVASFMRVCGQEAWEYSGLDEATHYLAAAYDGEGIVSLAGYRAWTEEAGDICILTRASHRNSGFATAVARAVLERARQDGKLLLYQTLESNAAAIKIAQRIGYEMYARHIAVRLGVQKPR